MCTVWGNDLCFRTLAVANLFILRDLPVFAGLIIWRDVREVEEFFILVSGKPRETGDDMSDPAPSQPALGVAGDVISVVDDGHDLGEDTVQDLDARDTLEVLDRPRVAALYFKLFSFIPCWGNVRRPFCVDYK